MGQDLSAQEPHTLFCFLKGDYRQIFLPKSWLTQAFRTQFRLCGFGGGGWGGEAFSGHGTKLHSYLWGYVGLGAWAIDIEIIQKHTHMSVSFTGFSSWINDLVGRKNSAIINDYYHYYTIFGHIFERYINFWLVNDIDRNDSSNESPVSYIIHQRVRMFWEYSSFARCCAWH